MSTLFNYFANHINSGNFDLLGFIGAILGVIGAYTLASYQFKKERKTEKNYALDMLCCLLNSTLTDTDEVIPRFIDVSKSYWEYKRYEPYLENIDHDGLKEEAILFFKRVDEDFYTNEQTLFFFESVIQQDRFNELKYNFNNSVNRYFNFEGLVYDENWYNHLKFIDNKNKFYREKIIKWIKLLNTTVIEIPDDPNKKGSYLNLSEFVELRDYIINFLKIYNYNDHKLYKEVFEQCINVSG